MKQFQIVENNKSFLKNETNINISGSQTQYLILSYVINDLNFSLTKFNRIKMTDERIEELLAIINKHQKINCTKTQLIKLLKMIFETWTVKYNKQKYLELRTLKLNLK